ncbi:hypothetical protein D3C77_349290 [compost metagenome]
MQMQDLHTGHKDEIPHGLPSWDDAPEWANWLGQCADGGWEFYEDEPVAKNDYWEHAKKGARTQMSGEPNSDWRNTLQKRPGA